MKLYYAAGSCSLSTHIVIKELGLEVELIQVDLRRHTVKSGGDYYDINELGYVPMLELDDGNTMHEGVVIMQYLADLAPHHGLIPAHGDIARYRLQEWLNFLSTEIHKGFIPLLYAIAAGKYVDTARPKLLKRFDWIDRQLADKPYLMGEGFCVADAYLFALTGWGKAAWLKSVYNADIDLTEFHKLKEWYERVRTRPAVAQAMQHEGLQLL